MAEAASLSVGLCLQLKKGILEVNSVPKVSSEPLNVELKALELMATIQNPGETPAAFTLAAYDKPLAV